MLGLSLAARAWWSSRIPLSGDEAYLWDWSRRLALGYYDHPPLAAYATAASVALLDPSSELAVRLPALLSMSVVAVLVHGVALRAGEELELPPGPRYRAASCAGLLVLALPVFAFFSVYASADALVCLNWIAGLVLGWRAATSGGWGAWLGLGAAVGAGLLAKFLFLPFLAVFAMFLVASPRRQWLARPRPWAALGVALGLNLPFLYWNWTHDWATFAFNFGARHRSADWAAFPEFVVSQLLVLSPLFFVLALIVAVRILVRRSERAHELERYGALFFLLPVAACAVLSFRERTGAHWPAAAAISACILVPLRLERSGRSRLALAALGVAGLLTFVGHLALLVPPAWLASSPLAHPTRPDQFNAGTLAELHGWPELGERVARTRAAMDEAQGQGHGGAFLLAAQYGFASQVAFYTPGQPAVMLWDRPRVHGQNHRYWDRFEDVHGQDALFVTKKESRLELGLAELREHFVRVHAPERLAIVVAGEEVRSFHLVRCEGFDGLPPAFP